MRRLLVLGCLAALAGCAAAPKNGVDIATIEAMNALTLQKWQTEALKGEAQAAKIALKAVEERKLLAQTQFELEIMEKQTLLELERLDAEIRAIRGAADAAAPVTIQRWQWETLQPPLPEPEQFYAQE